MATNASYKLKYSSADSRDSDSFSSSSSLDSLHEKMDYIDGAAKAESANPREISSSGKYRSNAFVYLAVLCAHMSSISMGCTFGWSAPALENMNEWKDTPFKPEKGQDNWIASVLTIGALIGAMFVGEKTISFIFIVIMLNIIFRHLHGLSWAQKDFDCLRSSLCSWMAAHGFFTFILAHCHRSSTDRSCNWHHHCRTSYLYCRNFDS